MRCRGGGAGGQPHREAPHSQAGKTRPPDPGPPQLLKARCSTRRGLCRLLPCLPPSTPLFQSAPRPALGNGQAEHVHGGEGNKAGGHFAGVSAMGLMAALQGSGVRMRIQAVVYDVAASFLASRGCTEPPALDQSAAGTRVG